MSRGSVGTRTTGRVTVSKAAPRAVIKSSAKRQLVENQREKLIREAGINPEDVESYTTLEIIDLLYVLKEPDYNADDIREKVKDYPDESSKVFPYESLLEDMRNEYEFVLNYTPQPIEARDCRKCGQKGTVTFIAFTYHRADEAGTSTFQCTQCLTYQ